MIQSVICSILTPTHPIPKGWGGVVGWGGVWGPWGGGWVGVGMLHIMLCIMLHVLDQKAYIPRVKIDRP